MARLSIPQTADILGLSQSTIRKRLWSGDLQGQKVKGAGGFRWEVFIDTDDDTDDANDGARVVELKARVNNLEEQLAIRAGEISELHRLLAQTALNAASGRPWWQFWR